MFDTRFNNGYQNTVTNTDPYADQYPNQMPQNPYAQGNMLPNMMSNNVPYPPQTPQPVYANDTSDPNTVNYADGGTVKKKKNRAENSPYPMLAEMIRRQGKGEDTVLAHINPLEAMILKNLGGSGTINPKTGLPQFGLFSNPKKWLKSVVGPAAGVVLGNMMPGVGGMIDEQKRLEKALRLSPEERAGMEANLLAEEQMRRRIARQKFLPEERLGNIEPLYRRSNTPEEYKKHGKWLSYYNNPQFAGEPLPYKEGGLALPEMVYEAEEMEYPSGLGRYIAGDTNGQDDKIPALLSDGEYVIPADVVAHLGDGNNAAGAKKLDMSLKKIRKQKRGGTLSLPPKAKPLASYLK